MARPDELSDPRLIPFIDRARIDCENMFEYRCPLYWGELDATGDEGVRHCNQCEHDVYLVTSEAELEERAERGECVAIVLPEELPAPEAVPSRLLRRARMARGVSPRGPAPE